VIQRRIDSIYTDHVGTQLLQQWYVSRTAIWICEGVCEGRSATGCTITVDILLISNTSNEEFGPICLIEKVLALRVWNQHPACDLRMIARQYLDDNGVKFSIYDRCEECSSSQHSRGSRHSTERPHLEYSWLYLSNWII
jgi:hypothetical protein